MLPFAELQREIAAETMAALANVEVARSAGAPGFVGRLTTRDRDAFDVAVVGSHTLRYLDQTPPLAKGEVLTIGPASYRVIDPPHRLTAHELTVELVAL